VGFEPDPCGTLLKTRSRAVAYRYSQFSTGYGCTYMLLVPIYRPSCRLTVFVVHFVTNVNIVSYNYNNAKLIYVRLYGKYR